MADTAARVLRLLSLLQARRSWPGQELMDRLGVSERTLRRDVQRLRSMGYAVSAVTGPGGGYQLDPGADIPPLLLDDEEAAAIAISLLTAAGGTVSGIEDTSVRALAKLEQVLPPRIRSRVSTLHSTVVPLVRPWVTVDAEALSVVAQACRDQERIRFEYQARDGEASERHVEPHRLVSIHQRWYLLAFDRDRQDWRTFRLDRVRAPRPTRMRFSPRPIPGGDPGRFLLRSIESRPMRYEVAATLHAPIDALGSRVHPSDGSLERLDRDRTLFRTQGDNLEWLAFRLLWLDVELEVHQPPELVEYLRRLAERLARAVG